MSKLIVLSCEAGVKIAREVSEWLSIPLGRMDIIKFSNDNKFVKVSEDVNDCDVVIFQSSSPPVDANLMELLLVIDACHRELAKSITVVLPYFPYSRTDKKDQPGVPVTAKLVCDLIRTAGADRIITLDLTADQIQGFFGRFDNISAMHLLSESVGKYVDLSNAAIVAPDAGGVKRAQKLAGILSLELAGMIVKDRVNKSGKVRISGIFKDITNKNIILIDDEIDTAYSLKSAARILKDAGAASITAVCTHAVFSGNALANIEQSEVTRVVTTNTFPVESGSKIIVETVAPLIAGVISKI